MPFPLFIKILKFTVQCGGGGVVVAGEDEPVSGNVSDYYTQTRCIISPLCHTYCSRLFLVDSAAWQTLSEHRYV